MNTEESIKHYLNSLSQLPGSILYRDRYQWKALPPGNSGNVLSLDSEKKPVWAPPAGGPRPMQFYGGTNGYWQRQDSNNYNGFMFTCVFTTEPRAGTSQRFLASLHYYNFSKARFRIYVGDASHSSRPNQLYIQSADNNGVARCAYSPNVVVTDGVPRFLFYSFDYSTGQSKFVLGNQEFSPALSSPGPYPNPAEVFQIAFSSLTANSYWKGMIGAVGYKNQYRDNWEDFAKNANEPADLDVASWTEFGGQPEVYNPYGELSVHRGSRPGFTRSGHMWIEQNY